jgi:hypothetical protein
MEYFSLLCPQSEMESEICSFFPPPTTASAVLSSPEITCSTVPVATLVTWTSGVGMEALKLLCRADTTIASSNSIVA